MEKYLFVAFRSREHSIKFFERLRSMRIQTDVINTPREAGVGCGLSVRFNEGQKNSVATALSRAGFSSFIGVFEVVYKGGKKYVSEVRI